jgi:hypothetical protein
MYKNYIQFITRFIIKIPQKLSCDNRSWSSQGLPQPVMMMFIQIELKHMGNDDNDDV